jgi:hypothetical protein
MDNRILNSMNPFGCLVLIPIGVMTLVWGIKEDNKR